MLDQPVYDEAFFMMYAADHMRSLLSRSPNPLKWILTPSEQVTVLTQLADLLSTGRHTLGEALVELEVAWSKG